MAPWGVDGYVKLEALTDSPDRLSPGAAFLTDRGSMAIETLRRGGRGLIARFCGIEDRNAAESLRGLLLYVPRHQVPPLPEGQYYHFQILDVDVWTPDGRFLGKVKEILTTGSNDVYVVRDGSKEALIPAIRDVIVDVDVEAGRMTVDPPEGLL